MEDVFTRRYDMTRMVNIGGLCSVVASGLARLFLGWKTVAMMRFFLRTTTVALRA
jgi:hypothetical protein